MQRACKLVVFVCVISICSSAVAGEREKTLAAKLGETFTLSKLNFTMTDVKTTGAVVVLQADGIVGAPAQTVNGETFTIPQNRILSKGNMKQTRTGPACRTFKAGDRFYVTDIHFTSGGKYSMLVFGLTSVDSFPLTISGTTLQSRYQADVAWNFAEQVLDIPPELILDQEKGLKENLDGVFKLESEANAVQTKSVELGQTPEQVEAALGKPGKVISLGAKTIYVYSDLKVVFMDGKVADVQ